MNLRNIASLATATLVFGAFATLAAPAHSAIVTFTGEDVGANQGDPLTNSNAAAASFNTAASSIGNESFINFESAPVGPFSSLNADSNTTVTGSDISSNEQTIRNTPLSSSSALFGYNTTSGGSQFLSLFGGSATFTFANGVNSFGAYFTGVQINGETVTFSDGSSESLALPNTGTGIGGAEFFGFTDAGQSIASVTVNASNDIIGVDDVAYSVPGSVVSTTPEPSGWMVLVVAGLGLGLLAVRARRVQNVA